MQDLCKKSIRIYLCNMCFIIICIGFYMKHRTIFSEYISVFNLSIVSIKLHNVQTQRVNNYLFAISYLQFFMKIYN